MPSALAITRSSGVVMNPRTKSALAPTYTVETCTTAISLRGYCRTLSERIACKPAIRITKLTQIASTGRLMKRSVIFNLVILGLRSRIVAWLDFVIYCHSRTVAQLEDAGSNNLIASINAGDDANLVAACALDFHELLANSAVGLSARTLQLTSDEDR